MYISVSQRFILAIEHLKDSKQIQRQAELCTILDVSKGYVSQLVNGAKEPSKLLMSKFTNRFPEINEKWLLTGEGDMLNNSVKNKQYIEHNSGTAITGDNTVVNPPEVISVSKMQNQIDELIAQNGKLLDIIDRLTK